MPPLLSADYPRFTLGAALTPAQAAFFDTNGFLHFTCFANAAQVAALRAAVASLAARWLAAGVSVVYGVPLQVGRELDGKPLVQRLGFASLFSSELAALAHDPRLLGLLPLLGPGVAGRVGEREKDGVVVNHYLTGPPGNFRRMGWHTDALRDFFYRHRPRPLLNVGLHLDDCLAPAGGLRVLPGTHRQQPTGWLRKLPFLCHRADPTEIALETRAGDLTVHHGHLWHRVAEATVAGPASRRRVVYVPLVSGAYRPRHPDSAPLLYQRLLRWVR